MTARSSASLRPAAVAAPVLAVAVAASCVPVPSYSLSRAPVNDCTASACSLYAQGAHAAGATCESGKCIFTGRPSYPFTILLNLPSHTFYGPDAAFILQSTNDLYGSTAFSLPSCKPPSCLPVPTLANVLGSYGVTQDAAKLVGVLLSQPQTSIPVRVTFIPQMPGDGTTTVSAAASGLPVDRTFASSSRFTPTQSTTAGVLYEVGLPAGSYTRLSYPEPPFDALLPPSVESVTIPPVLFSDNFTLATTGVSQIDDPSGDSRVANVTRPDGLDGFSIWLADHDTQARVSVLKTLSGTSESVRLDTTGFDVADGNTALRDGIDVVVAPSSGSVGVPRLQSELIGGQGLKGIVYPSLPPSASVRGLIAEKGDDGVFHGVPSTVSLASETILTSDGTTSTLLTYATTVATDESGRFATVLPPGSYDVVIEPVEGTGFGKVKKTIDLAGSGAITLSPPPRSVAGGHVVLGDGRPLASAKVYAFPSKVQVDPTVVPRPGTATTDDGGVFSMELDQGSYDLTIVPEAGTGFPRVVTLRGIGSPTEDLGDITVPAPTVVALTLRDASVAVAGALIRLYATAAGAGAGSPLIEVGEAVTDADGKCEILLADQPH